MKKEILIATTGTALLLIVLIFQFDGFKSIELVFIASLGLLAAAKFNLIGGTLLTFSGIALVVHPFMFASTFWVLPGALLVSIAGIMILINWWKQNSK